MKTCTYKVCHMVPEQRVKTCTYKVCKMVPEQRVKTCTYKVCKMVPEQRVKTCYYKVCHMVPAAVRQAGAVHGLQAGALHEDGQLREAGAEEGRLHGHPLRARWWSASRFRCRFAARFRPAAKPRRRVRRPGAATSLALYEAHAFRRPAEGLV